MDIYRVFETSPGWHPRLSTKPGLQPSTVVTCWVETLISYMHVPMIFHRMRYHFRSSRWSKDSRRGDAVLGSEQEQHLSMDNKQPE
jgi:hypothetical protein